MPRLVVRLARALGIAAPLLLTAAVAAPGQTPLPVAHAQHSHDEHFTIGDGDVSVRVPASHTAVGVVVLHSLGNSSAEPPTQGWSRASDRYGFVGIYPERSDSWNAGLCCGSAAQDNRDDVGWLVQVIAQMRARYALTTIYLAGFSNGGMMVERLVAERPELSSCFAVWGAAPEMPVAANWSGQAFVFDGNEDNIVRQAGGLIPLGATVTRMTRIRPAADTARWLRGSRVTLETIVGLGHKPASDWPDLAWNALHDCRDLP